jgi:adenylate kinase family enzyme
MKKIFVFNGIHGSGKTTLAENLALQHPETYVFYPEVGRKLREEVDYNSLESGEDFDREVMRRELERDKLLLAETRIPLVETWHIGNIGYLAARSPQLITEYEATLRKQLGFFDPVAVFVDISWQAFRQRISEKIQPSQVEELIQFYKLIAAKTFDVYRELGIVHTLVNNEGKLDEGLLALRREIESRIQHDAEQNQEIHPRRGKER